jgi:lysophospholipase L1-like esterase
MAAIVAMLVAAPSVWAEILVKDGETIAFLGDSITQQGGSPGGYVSLVMEALKANGVKAKAINAGISGHKSNQMLARLDKDVIEKKPQWMTLSCGVNDVWHGERGVPLEQYKQNITQIVDKAKAAGIKVVILTATMIKEDPAEDNNKKLAAYNDFLRTLAKEKGCPLADLNAMMQASLDQSVKAGKQRGLILTADGVHMNFAGNEMMASGVATALGLDTAQLAKATEAWMDIPGTVAVKVNLTGRQYQKIEAAAAKQGKPADTLIQDAVRQAGDAPAK